MSISSMLWSLDSQELLPTDHLVNEQELEEALHKNIDLLDPNWLVIGRQVKTRNGKFLDLLCMDRDGSLVVVELKRELTPREVTAQVIEYASYMAEKKPEELAQIYLDYSARYLDGVHTLDEAFRQRFGTEYDEDQLTLNVKMVIVASKMDNGTEHIINFLRNTYSVDINILFFQVFRHGDERLLSRTWFQEDLETTAPAGSAKEWNHEYYVSFGAGERVWADAQKYGFISAGGGSWYTQTLGMLHPGDRVWVNMPHVGYLGVGIVQGEVQQASYAQLLVNGASCPMKDCELQGDYFYSEDDPERAEYIVPVEWIKTVSQVNAVKEAGFFGNQNTVCRPQAEKWVFTVGRLKTIWGVN